MYETIARTLLPTNCRYNFKIEDDGKCYSGSCMMNSDPELKEKILKQGCGVFNMPEVQSLLEETHNKSLEQTPGKPCR